MEGATSDGIDLSSRGLSDSTDWTVRPRPTESGWSVGNRGEERAEGRARSKKPGASPGGGSPSSGSASDRPEEKASEERPGEGSNPSSRADRDEELVRRSLEGSPDAFERIIERYRGVLTRFFRRRFRGPARVEEAVSETFSRAWEGLGRFRGERLEPWLITIAKRVSSEQARKESVWRSIVENYITRRISGSESFSSSLREEALRQELKQEFQRLEELDQKIILFRIIKRRSCRRTALKLGMSRYEVRRRLERSLAALRELLEETDF